MRTSQDIASYTTNKKIRIKSISIHMPCDFVIFVVGSYVNCSVVAI
jgi:hypothetical protein